MPADVTEFVRIQNAEFVRSFNHDGVDELGYANLRQLGTYAQINGARILTIGRRTTSQAFVVSTGRSLDECWVRSGASRKTCVRVFRAFLAERYRIWLESLHAVGFDVDHIYARDAALRERVGFVRLAAVDSAINQSWGPWEWNSSRNDPRRGRNTSLIALNHLAKVCGKPGPNGMPSEEYIADFARFLRSVSTSRFDEYDMLRIFLYRGAPVPDGVEPMQHVMHLVRTRLPIPVEGWRLTPSAQAA